MTKQETRMGIINRKHASGKKIQYWLSNFNIEQYMHDHTLPDDLPSELADFIERFEAKTETVYKQQLQQQQFQYQALQNQINPHFLYNTLECIRSEAIFSHNDSIAKMTEAVSRFFRYNISARDNIVTLRDELLCLQDYFYIQEYRFGKRYQLRNQITDEDILNSFLPQITLQPIVENALLHGLADVCENGIISIRAQKTDSLIYIWVSDNGCGIPAKTVQELNTALQNGIPSPSSRHSGIALTNINSRLKLYFGQEYGLRIVSLPGKGTDVEICYPIKSMHNTSQEPLL